MRKLSHRFYTALDLAISAHSGQKRGEFENYVVHVIEVAHILIGLGPELDEDIIIAGLLHDTIEDCGVTWEYIAKTFGERVVSIVAEVTDDPRLPRHLQKEEQIAGFYKKSMEALIVKLADRLSNFAGQTGKVRSEKYYEHTREILIAFNRRMKLVAPENQIKFRFPLILAEQIEEALKTAKK